MPGTTSDDLYEQVPGLTGLPRDEAVAKVLEIAGGDRAAVEQARNRFATWLRGRTDDYRATAALTLLNRALATEGPDDPLDWKRRWARGRKP